MTEVILVRHGETIWNQGGRYQGHSDIELSENGRRQAQKLRDRLRSVPLAAAYASDLSRARETAAIVAAPHGLEVQTTASLREMNFGAWEGLSFAEIKEQHAELAARWYTSPKDITLPQGESFTQLKERAYGALLDLVARHREQTILLASHGGTIRAILCGLLDLDLNRIWRLRQDNTAVNIIQFFDRGAMLKLFNDTHHLEE